jgi:predicted dehydrogenase/threonine dehydrogenase-like Zn-dependent dehydrogenase
MRVIAEDYKTGAVSLLDVPRPAVKSGCLLVSVEASLISSGTERAMIEVASKSLLGKALARPDWVKQVFDKIKSDGLIETWRQARARLDTPVPLGYSAAGVVTDVGAGVSGFSLGDRVACAGHPYAAHAEVLCVPRNLCVQIPAGVSFEDASYVMLGAIALNAVRLAEPQLGERVAVIGLGLLGLIGVQLLRAAGCRVIGIDVSPDRLELARTLGATDAILAGQAAGAVAEFSGNQGVDSTIVFASSESSGPVEQAAEITRERGKLVVPGLVKLDLPRKTFFEKELRLVVPRAGGPGSGDAKYEVGGHDVPLPLVRWTEGRNLTAFLELIADKRVTLAPLTTHRFTIDKALDAYKVLKGDVESERPPIGIILTYPHESEFVPARIVHLKKRAAECTGPSCIGVGLIGAGLFTKGVFLPILKKLGSLDLRGVATASGISARHAAERAGFAYCTTDYRELLLDSSVNAVLITTRHDLHSRMAVEALEAGKHVFVEKPLALNEVELRRVLEAWQAAGDRILMVGFNRRFAPATRYVMDHLTSGKAVVHCRVNAGPVAMGSWVQDEMEGGGRIVGEVCHFVDLIHAFGGGLVCSVSAVALRENSEQPMQDTVTISLGLDSGSIGSIVYAANGDKAFPRERVEVFRAGTVGTIENFRSYTVTQGGRTRRKKAFSLDRGHSAELTAFFSAIRNGIQPVTMEDYVATTLATFRIQQSLREKALVRVETMSEFLAGPIISTETLRPHTSE